jgi:hypothetical protein
VASQYLVLVAVLPQNTLTAAIAQKVNEWAFLISVERSDRLLQTAFWELVISRGQGVVDARRPRFLFKGL